MRYTWRGKAPEEIEKVREEQKAREQRRREHNRQRQEPPTRTLAPGLASADLTEFAVRADCTCTTWRVLRAHHPTWCGVHAARQPPP